MEQTNISRRDYFAAHAPEMPDWFTPDEKRLPVPVIFPGHVTAFLLNHLDSDFIRCHYDEDLEGNWTEEAKEKYADKVDKINTDIKEHSERLMKYHSVTERREAAALAQWRYFYADAMESQR